MIPLNLLLAVTVLMMSVDLYQLVEAVRGFEGVHHFATELFESGFSTAVTAVLVLIGLVKSPEYRTAKVFFLVFLFLDSVFDVIICLQTDGKTPAQMAEMTKQMAMPLYFLLFNFPAFVGCVIFMTGGISFQMRTPFFHRYAQIAPWQSIAMGFFSIVYYLEALSLLLLVTGLIA